MTAPDPAALFDLGDWIAYQTVGESGSDQVYLVHPDGSDQHPVAPELPGNTMLPDWSPDGTWLVFTNIGTGATEPFRLHDLESGETSVPFPCEDPCLGDDEPAFSPDGTRVAFIRAQLPIVDDIPADCALWVGDLASGQTERLTTGVSCSEREVAPRWSPDGTALAYFKERYEDGQLRGTAIFVLDLETGAETQITEWELNAGYPDWSPDGDWIVFATHPVFSFGDVAGDLYRMRPDGSGIERLTFFDDATSIPSQPRYVPGGEWIVFAEFRPDGRLLHVIPAEGGEPVLLPMRGIYTHPAWQP
jgi:Tol biopolymer transport system component